MTVGSTRAERSGLLIVRSSEVEVLQLEYFQGYKNVLKKNASVHSGGAVFGDRIQAGC